MRIPALKTGRTNFVNALETLSSNVSKGEIRRLLFLKALPGEEARRRFLARRGGGEEVRRPGGEEARRRGGEEARRRGCEEARR